MLRDFNCKGNGGKKIEKINEEPDCAPARKGSGTRTSPKSAGANSTSIIPASSISTGTWKKDKGFALVPYLAVGCLLSLLV